jgi:hypothetical protein
MMWFELGCRDLSGVRLATICGELPLDPSSGTNFTLTTSVQN